MQIFSWVDPTTGQAFTSPNQFPGTLEEFTRGGVKGKYSARFIDNVSQRETLNSGRLLIIL